jgi:hypothetical protein
VTSESHGTAPRKEDAFCEELSAIFGGIVFSAIAVFGVMGPALTYVWRDAEHLGYLVLALYPALAVSQFWVSRAYLNGMTKRELLAAIFFLADVVRTIRFGVRSVRGQITGMNIREHGDQGKKIVSAQTAIRAGVVLTLVAFVLMLFGLYSQLSMAWSAVCFAVVLWVLCSITYYWEMEAYKGGLTEDEVLRTLLGPVSIIRMVREGVREFAEMQKQDGPVTG